MALGKNADGIQEAVFDQVDFFNIMAYDGPGQNHSSYEFAEEALNYWRQRGLPQSKTVLGVPFYSRPGEAPYRTLVAADPAAATGGRDRIQRRRHVLQRHPDDAEEDEACPGGLAQAS